MYCTKADLILRFNETEITNLSDVDGNGLIDEDVLQRAIDDASYEIDSYLVSKYSLPLVNPPADLVRKACDITRFHLYQSRGFLKDNDSQIERNYLRIIRYLEQVSKGTIELQITPSDTATASNGSLVSSNAPRGWEF